MQTTRRHTHTARPSLDISTSQTAPICRSKSRRRFGQNTKNQGRRRAHAAWSTAPHRTRPSPSGQSEQRGGAKEPAGKAMSSRETKPTNPRIPKAAAGVRGWICSPAFLNLLCRCSAPTPRQEPGSRRCLEGNCMTVDQVCRSVRHSQGQPRPPCSTRRPNPASRIMTKRIDHGILGHHAHADTTHEIRPQYARQMDARGTHLNPKSECVPNIFAL